MKHSLLLPLMVFLTQFSFAQIMEGKVTDLNTHRPVTGATVETSIGWATLTDSNGYFRFSRLKAGAYTVSISCIGYKPLVATLHPGGKIVTLEMETWNLMMQPVEVKAIRAAENAPFAKTNLLKKDIALLNLGQDLPFLLNQTPSVVVNADAGNGIGYTGIRIRGTDATRINMTINGIPYNDAESQGIFFVNLPDLASSIESIQIQRGVGTSSNGAGAFGATLNVSTNEVNTLPYTEINNSFGSFRTRKHTVKAGTGLLHDHFTLDLRLSNIVSDGYIDRAASNLQSLYASAAYLTPNTSLRFNVISGMEKTYQAWYGVNEEDLKINRRVNYAGTERPGAPYDNETDNYRQDHYQFFFNHRASAQWSLQSALFLTKGKGYYEQYKADQPFAQYGVNNYTLGNTVRTNTDLIRQLWLDNTFFGQTFSAMYETPAEQLTIGGGWSGYLGNHFGEIIWAKEGVEKGYRWYDHDARKTDVYTYVKYQYRLGKHQTFFGDVQFRNVGYQINGFRENPGINIQNNFQFINPKIGWKYLHNHYEWYISYALGQKEPNRDDFEAGTRELPRPEKLHDLEAGIAHKTNVGGWNAGFFFMYYKDQLVLTGRINDVGAYTRSNIPKSYRVGVELQAHARLTEWWNISGNATLSRNKVSAFKEYVDDYDNGGQKIKSYQHTDLAFSPAVTAQATLDFHPLPKYRLQLLSKIVGRQYLDNTSNSERQLNAFWVQDLHMQYTVAIKKSMTMQFILQVNNLLNLLYAPNGYTFSYWYDNRLATQNYYYPMAGRNGMAGIHLRF